MSAASFQSATATRHKPCAFATGGVKTRSKQSPSGTRVSSFYGSGVSRTSFFGENVSLATPKMTTPPLPIDTQTVAREIQVDVPKPLGLKLAQSRSKGGGLEVKNANGNAAKAGMKPGDTVIYISSYFGDELWPADKLGFAQIALQRAPSPVTLVYVKGENTAIDVKRLGKKPAPPRFGRKLTAAQKERATHICVDCGYIYCDPTPFEDLDPDYRCPQCRAPKKRFARYDAVSEKQIGGATGDLGTLATVIGGLIGVAILGYIGIQF